MLRKQQQQSKAASINSGSEEVNNHDGISFVYIVQYIKEKNGMILVKEKLHFRFMTRSCLDNNCFLNLEWHCIFKIA